MLPASRRLDGAWLKLDDEGHPPAGLMSADIYDSWMRCITLGLDALRPPSPEFVDAAVLRQEQQRCSLVRGLALAEMHTLHQQIAGSNFMIAFATAEGLLLDSISDSSFSDASDAACIRAGSIWTESICGTNGLGTAAYLKRPIVVHGREHFFARYNNLTCVAAPIFAPDGEVAGILDASSDCMSRQAHTQALVAMAATQIENGLFREQHRGNILIAFHNRGEYLHTLSAGLLAVDNDGRILAANRAARVLLHGLPAFAGRLFGDVFRGRFSDFVDEGRRKERQRLEDDVGSQFVATIENSRQFPMTHRVLAPRPAPPKSPAAAFVSADPRIAAIVQRVAIAAARKMPILIRGETGTGKEQMARHAHAASRRAGSFVAVNCAALPDSLIEAELFGYTEGAFTGARKGGSAGLFKEADGGTLFLDEIGDMPVTLQAVLLRFLDDWTVRPVGGSKREVDVLLVSATNANLDDAIAKGRFRSDLLFRLNTLEVTLLPLRERTDFADIARHLMTKIDPSIALSEAAIQRLAQRSWDGNIRELRNVLARLSLSETGPVIDAATVDAAIGPGSAEPVAPKIKMDESAPADLHEIQRALVLATFAETGNNISKTARRLGISRNTVYRALRGKPG
ncbi:MULTISPECIES: sigma-54-dependent Fis family transcriptional regulator [Bradyrhizobium]|jgi:transcriptional regulator of acetoin/glycerol metabolism|uniref:Sigma-54-dependent Fis family transcriptional regulator n=4 Tax=Bradyrhizobium TaxID=374 RepID=A0ABS5GDJ5_9BRAD|nr:MULTISPECIES: sigma-54-dependent Fis family transcriptional regulator [Bradyrhizobium]MBR1139059.1 sigma-54-dependent Fis family transcriptional regulator [Bradyrhizobium denitrificans]MDU0954788.1 sigma-54-dependent Fis family transcriptional regulator [Bradyrhizobium sp.]MDU1495298.1 sigma-54-dependent Fis family transcriptional regulator [Bradyrhizobium sp.]MDU1547941.1 sigma-54-dependent Fis family transcriptional regulator [Bradyrhizobium sp.]MDU1803726.1 sigma-54-dependent Fis family 